jgi:hypothetical protein
MTPTIDPIPTGWRAFYDPEGLVGEGKRGGDAVRDLADKLDEALGIAERKRNELFTEAAHLAERLNDVTRERDRKQEIIAYVIQTLHDGFPGMDECAPAEAIARKVAKRHADVTRERDELDRALGSLQELLAKQITVPRDGHLLCAACGFPDDKHADDCAVDRGLKIIEKALSPQASSSLPANLTRGDVPTNQYNTKGTR